MVRMVDVASRAGVSVATVSNYISGKKYVSDEVKQKVKQAIDDLGYEVNIAARCLKSNRTFNIGVIIPEISSIYFTQIFKGLRDAALGTNYTFSFMSTDYNFEEEKRAVYQLKNGKVDGILINSCCNVHKKRQWARELVDNEGKKRFPVLSLEYDMDDGIISSLVLNNFAISKESAEYLISRGRKKILYISANQSTIVGYERLNGYKSALEDAGIEVRGESVYEGNLSSYSGYMGVHNAIEQGLDFDAVQAVNDQSAIGALKALKEKGLQVPDQVMLVGCDNLFPSTLVSPQITTVNLPTYTLGMEGFKIIKMMIEEPDTKPIKKEVVHTFIERQSTNKECASEWNLTRW
jgi:DNA-binding LacI/PurR family transcriptional regulator